MRHITEVKREKNVYNISLKELKEGKWLKLLEKASDMIEIQYKNGFITISDCNITKADRKSEKEEDKNGR